MTIESSNKPKIKLKLRKSIITEPLQPDNLTGSDVPETKLKPFWNTYTKTVSQKLWSPTKINSIVSNLKCSDRSLQSWFSVLCQKQTTEPQNWQKIYSLLSPKNTDSVPHKIDKLELKARIIKMLPNQQEKTKLRTWFGIYRFIYNKGLEILKNKAYESGSLLSQLRNRLVKDENYQTENQWVRELPADTRDYAVKELLKAFKTNLKAHQSFQMTFKSKKKSQSIEFRAQRQYNVSRGNYKFLSEIKKTEPVPDLTHDIKVQQTPNGSFNMIIPMDVVRNENQVPHRIISIDPGVRTFMTGYSPDGFVYHLGNNDIQRMSRLLHQQYKLQSRVKQHKRKNKHRIRKAFKRMSYRIKHLVDECHKKLTHWLFENFDYIIIPKLDTSAFCRKNMSRKVKNKIKVWRHCSLIDRLHFKQREYLDSTLLVPSEEYTSKTCSHCGSLNHSLGRSKEFVCPEPSCQRVFDRDVNGAFNILLKVLTQQISEHLPEAEDLINNWV